jgi:integrator complex subunit 11
MFSIFYKGRRIVYTGDFNSSADRFYLYLKIIIRHLGAAWIDKLYPDLLISESTYATTYRDSKRARETDFLHQV